jgi:hypothetical protein
MTRQSIRNPRAGEGQVGLGEALCEVGRDYESLSLGVRRRNILSPAEADECRFAPDEMLPFSPCP